MQSTVERFWTSFSRPTSFPAALRYGFLIVILALVCFNVSLKLRTYPHYFVRGQQAGMEWLHPEITRLDLNNYVVVSMLLLNHLAFGFAWSSRRVRVGLRVVALVGCVFGRPLRLHHPVA